MASPRSSTQRKADALALLSAPEADAWVATASSTGEAYMVPLSIGWTGESIVLVTEARSTTAKNLARALRARLAVGGSRDVVMIDAAVLDQQAVPDASPRLIEAFASQSGWDPRKETNAGEFRLFELRPVQLQSWREANEIAERTLMRSGVWVT